MEWKNYVCLLRIAIDIGSDATTASPKKNFNLKHNEINFFPLYFNVFVYFCFFLSLIIQSSFFSLIIHLVVFHFIYSQSLF